MITTTITIKQDRAVQGKTSPVVASVKSTTHDPVSIIEASATALLLEACNGIYEFIVTDAAAKIINDRDLSEEQILARLKGLLTK